MTEVDVRRIFKEKQAVTDKLRFCENEQLREKLIVVMENLAIIEADDNLVQNMLISPVRFSDYHSFEFSAVENVNFFCENYLGSDKDEQKKYYLLSSLLNDIKSLVYLVNDGEFAFNDIIDLCNNGTFYDDLLFYSEELRKTLELERMNQQALDDSKMDFTREDNLYKILFAGFSYDDIKELPKHVKLQVIKKLNNPLATEKVVQLAEGVDHVRDAYGFPLQRIQVADDYRIAFVRRGNVTAILGVRLKSGKNSDYTRYDSIAKSADKLYEQIDEFSLGMVQPSETHTKTVELCQEVYDKSNGAKK